MEKSKKHETTVSTESQESGFVYVVYNHVPEFIAHIAVRRNKHFKASDMKIIKCPHCRGTFRTVDKTEKIELYRHSAKAKYHTSLPCHTCYTSVGVIYASA